ncbi:MAG: class I SAM-dependent methyltransferase, partial [Chryseobacterium sp.]
ALRFAIGTILGVKDASELSLLKFDKWYLDFYPYLEKHISFSKLSGMNVLEIGLGYGTVAQRVVEHGAVYSGLDIALGPVKMVRHRIKQIKLKGNVVQGSILQPPFPDQSFDAIVAIGCLHHTGDLQLAIDECYKLLKPGGSLIFMVYYAYSYRRWIQNTSATLKYLLTEIFGSRRVVEKADAKQRSAYDINSKSEAAPHTDWISKKSLRKYCKDFSQCEMSLENIDQATPSKNKERSELLKTIWPKLIGLDLYVKATR